LGEGEEGERGACEREEATDVLEWVLTVKDHGQRGGWGRFLLDLGRVFDELYETSSISRRRLLARALART